MKRLILLLLVLILATPCFAATKEELTAEAQQLLQQKAQYEQVLQNINVRLIEIQGAMKNIEAEKDKAIKKAEVKK